MNKYSWKFKYENVFYYLLNWLLSDRYLCEICLNNCFMKDGLVVK